MAYSDPYRVVMLGGGGVGKSAITVRFIQNTFLHEYDPTIEDTYRKTIRVDDETSILEVNDTAGQEGFSAMRETWIRYGEAYLLVYSIENRGSFARDIEVIVRQIERVRDLEISEAATVLFANKVDLAKNRQVQEEEGSERARELGSHFFEGSAKTFVNVEEAFSVLIRAIRVDRSKRTPPPPIASRTNRGIGCSLF